MEGRAKPYAIGRPQVPTLQAANCTMAAGADIGGGGALGAQAPPSQDTYRLL